VLNTKRRLKGNPGTDWAHGSTQLGGGRQLNCTTRRKSELHEKSWSIDGTQTANTKRWNTKAEHRKQKERYQ